MDEESAGGGGAEGDGKKSLSSARWTRKTKRSEESYWDVRERHRERTGGSDRKSEREAEREGEKEMQRLPYNGAPRAHKLRHNVISSSLFNERWQRGARTFYHDVFAVLARSPSDLSLFFFSFFPSLFLSFLVLSSYLLPAPYHRYTTITNHCHHRHDRSP